MKNKFLLLSLIGLVFAFFILKYSTPNKTEEKDIAEPVAVIVPHHDIVKDKRKELFAEVAQKRKETNHIILLSPDHFSTHQNAVTMNDEDHKEDSGTIEYDSQIGDQFKKILDIDNARVNGDHGIGNILPDIKTYFPQAKVVPMILGQKIKKEDLGKLIEIINQTCKDDCLIIASVDFSHYLPYQLADFHDENSIYALSTLDFDEIAKLEVDSPQSLFVTAKVAEKKQALHFNLFAHTNSTKMADLPDTEGTSHILGYYTQGQKLVLKKPQTFTFATNLARENNLNLLGERFFYGVTTINTLLSQPYIINNITITPSKSTTQIVKQENNIKIILGPDFAIAGESFPDKTQILFLPLSYQSGKAYLLRGQEKDIKRQLLLKGFNAQNGLLTL